MQYPIFVTVVQASQLLGVGKTTIYALKSAGKLRVAKFNRSTRITFSSLIEYALEGLAAGSGTGEISEILLWGGAAEATEVAEHFARQLCYIHESNTEAQEEAEFFPERLKLVGPATDSAEKNSGGEF